MAKATFNATETAEYRKMFDDLDSDKSGKLDHSEVQALLRAAGEEVSYARVGEIISMIDINQDGLIDFEEFINCMSVIKSGGGIGGQSSAMKQFGTASAKAARVLTVKGEGGTVHSISEEEREAFAEHINLLLGNDPLLASRLPMDPTSPTALFDCCKDGLIFIKLINIIEPGTVDMRAVNKKEKLSKFQTNENNNLAINAAKSIGCHLVNIGATNIMDGIPHLVLGIAWQIIRKTLLNNISLKNHPELWRLLEEGEELKALARLPPEQILIRWVNFQLKRAESSRSIANFGADLKDSEVYSTLLHQLDPSRCPLVASHSDKTMMASQVIDNVKAMGLKPFLKPKDIVSGNAKLNLGMVAQIFNANPGLSDLSAEEEEERMSVYDFAGLEIDENNSDTREERTFRNWMNSLNLEGFDGPGSTLYINDLYFDLCGGLPILKLMDRIEPGIVPWKKTHAKPKGRIHTVDNCNLVVSLAKQMDLVVVNIGGTDIVDQNKMLILAIMWQLMRRFTLDLLKTLSADGSVVTEKTVVAWGNTQVSKSKNPPAPIKNLNDKLLSNGVYLLHLCESICKGTVDWSLVISENESEDDMISNANYVISVARKLGACVFITPEDITEVKPKMIFSFIASLWVESLKEGPGLGAAQRGTTPPRGLSPPRGMSPPKPSPAAAAQPPPPPPPPAAPAPVAEAAPPPPPPPPPVKLVDTPQQAPPSSSSGGGGGFSSVNGSGEVGGVYGGVSGSGNSDEVDESEWD